MEGLNEALPHLTDLSRIADPTIFMPELQRICADVGLAVAIVRPPRGCPVSGVAMSMKSGVRVVGLSGRYLSDDHLWFTFMHEVAHLLLHDPQVYVDDIDRQRTGGVDEHEIQADALASRILLSGRSLAVLGPQPTPMAIHGFGIDAGVSNGVVVGQLQHAGILPFDSRLNRLKHRYSWDGTVLVSQTA